MTRSNGRSQVAVNGREPVTVEVHAQDYRRLNARPALHRYLNELYHWRHFIVSNARSRSLQSGSDMFLGRAWLVLQPLFDVLMYAVIFGLILRVSRGIENYLGYLVIGVVFIRFVSKALNTSAGIVQSSKSLMSSFTFPRAAVVISALLRQMIDNLIPASVGVVVAFLFQYPNGPSLTTLLIVPLYLMIHLFALGCMLIIARITAFIPDVKPLVTLLNRGLFFVSGVFYSLERFDGHATLIAVMRANPVYQFLLTAREVTIYRSVPDPHIIISLTCWTFGVLLFGLIFFWRAEERYATVS